MASLETGEFKRGPGGRPTREEAKRRHVALLETAMRVFLARGLDAASIDEIAKQAGVAKRFLYARYRDKSELFAAAVEHMIVEKLQELHAFQPPRRRAEFGLLEFGRKLRATATAPDGLALMRLFIAAAPKFPGLVQRFYDRNRQRGASEIERVLAFYAERGEIELKQPQLMAEQFVMSVAGIAQRLALFGIRETPEEEERRLRTAVKLFLDGCRASPQPIGRKGTARKITIGVSCPLAKTARPGGTGVHPGRNPLLTDTTAAPPLADRGRD